MGPIDDGKVVTVFVPRLLIITIIIILIVMESDSTDDDDDGGDHILFHPYQQHLDNINRAVQQFNTTELQWNRTNCRQKYN